AMLTGAALLAGAPAIGQPAAPMPPPAEPATATRAELEAARRELAEAARRVAELSATEADRWIRDFDVRRVVAPRVRLGIVIGDEPEGGRAGRSVSRDGPAAKAGIEPGDVLLAVDGRELGDATVTTLVDDVLAKKEPGDV